MAGRRKTAEVDHSIAGSRRNRSSTTTGIGLDNMPEGVAGALEKVRELNEAKDDSKAESKDTQSSLSELRELLFFGRIKEQIEIGGFLFEISTLTNKQQRALITRLVKLTGEERLLHIKPMTLSEVLVSINGVPVEELYDGDAHSLSDFEMRLEVISNLQSALVERLFEEYERINKKSSDLIGSRDLGDEVKK